jgi:hypothetical protein
MLEEDTLRTKVDVLKKKMWILRFLPFVEAVYLTGSVANCIPHRYSDLDLLIITRQNRLWSCIFFTKTVLRLLGQSRINGQNNPKVTSDKFCPNHFVSVENPELTPNGELGRYLYFNAQPLITSPRAESILLNSNDWLLDKKSESLPFSGSALRRNGIKLSPKERTTRRFHPSVKISQLFSGLGDLAETVLKIAQLRKILSNTEKPDCITKYRASFHPKPEESAPERFLS